MAAYSVVLTQEARDNIEEITGYIAEQSGFGPASSVLKRITDGLPYIAPFLIDEAASTVTVIAVYHGKMNWQT